MRWMSMLVAVAAVFVISGSTASAEQICDHHFFHSDEITVARFGSTSCSLARSGAEHVINAGHAPASVLAYSRITGRHYRMFRISHVDTSSFFTATYRGFGKANTRIGFRLTIIRS
jgi:hypothetical protein